MNPWVRRDDVNYYPSGDPFNDTPATLSQHRTLTNWGVRADLAKVAGRHNIKIGTELKQTRLGEEFALGITDPGFNPVCVDALGNAAGAAGIVDPNACAGAGLTANPGLLPGLVPYDLTRGGSLFQFNQSGNVNQAAVYLQDAITFGRLILNAGLRVDRYDGVTQATSAEPRFGVSYQIKADGNGGARVGFAHDGDAVQREPAAFERCGRGRAGIQSFSARMPRNRCSPGAATSSTPGCSSRSDASCWWMPTTSGSSPIPRTTSTCCSIPR